MPREIPLFTAMVPTLLLIFLASLLIYGVVDLLLSRWDWDRYFWHPALLRLALFVCLFASLSLGVYG